MSISFLVLGAILLILGDQLLEDSRDRVLEQRLVIAQMVANQVDRSLTALINDLELTLHLTDFDPSDPNLDAERKVMSALYADTSLPIIQLTLLDAQGNIVLAQPPMVGTTGSNLPYLSQITDAINGEDILVSTPWHDATNNNLVVAITIPIFDEDRFLGSLSSVIDLDESSIKALLVDAVTQDKTAHAILVDSLGRSLISTLDLPFLSPGEHQTFYRRAMTQNRPVVEEVLFELDLPGEPPGHHHIMAFVPLKNAAWGVSVGGDVIEETFAGQYRLFLWLASFFILSILVIWGGTLISTRKLLEPVQKTNLKFDISRQITNTKDWGELTSLIVRIPSAFMPVSDTRLLMPDDHHGIQIVSEWKSGGKSLPCPNPTQTAEICEACALARKTTAISLAPCLHRTDAFSSEQLTSYCFPLVHHDSLVGILHFCIPSDVPILDRQIDILESVASDMAIALESAQLQQLNVKQAEITLAEKNRIFRRLHDTIGQNISYLHLKLDQYSKEDRQPDLPEIQRDILAMRDIANQAYDQMRSMLTDLNPETQTDLIAALRSRAGSMAERANFKLEMTVEGKPANIPQLIKRHMLFICYETLNNIERHAHAQNVSIQLLWGNDDLTITIVDDGIGFDLDKVPSGEHFGISIMEDRARSISGRLTFSSSNKGTSMTLWVPL